MCERRVFIRESTKKYANENKNNAIIDEEETIVGNEKLIIEI